jgi:hypothetical protein
VRLGARERPSPLLTDGLIRIGCETAGSLLSTADIGIVVAGVVGPGLAYIAGWRSDIRRFGEERRLKASDDLHDRIDEVGATLEALGAAAVGVRSETLRHGTTRAPELWEVIRVAEDAYQTARVSIARLEMRAHADDDLTKAAKDAAEVLGKATHIARKAMITRQVRGSNTTGSIMEIAEIPQMVEDGYEGIRRYQREAKRADAALVGTASRPARLFSFKRPTQQPQQPPG